jgi:Zn-dependent peptidase ImmA (M78 family)
MEPPKQIKILNLMYQIRWVDRQIEAATDSHGFCDVSEQLIVVNGDQQPQAVADTLLHEITHALFDALALAGEQTEERLVRLLSTGLCTVLQDNPNFTKWWTKKL